MVLVLFHHRLSFAHVLSTARNLFTLQFLLHTMFSRTFFTAPHFKSQVPIDLVNRATLL